MNYLYSNIKWGISHVLRLHAAEATVAVLLLGATSVLAGPLPTVTGAVFAPATGRTTITWQDADGSSTSYNIYRASSPINAGNLPFARRIASRVASGTGTFAFQVTSSGQSYYAVLPVTTAGTETRTFTVNIAGPVSETDATPPSAPLLSGVFAGMTVNLSWGPIDARNSEDVVKWQVMRKVGSGSPTLAAEYFSSYDPVSENSSQPVPASGTYEYSVKAFDSSGNVSASSNTILAANLPDLAISPGTSIATNADVAVSKAFPKKNQSVQLTLTVRNAGAAASGASTARMADGLGYVSQQAVPSLAAQASANLTFAYTPSAAGLVPLTLTLDSSSVVTEISESNNAATVQIPVVTNDTYILWYGDVPDLKYVNLSQTHSYGISEWKRRGAYAMSSAGAVGTLAELTTAYKKTQSDGFDAFAIDEVFNGGANNQNIVDAIAATKVTYPNCFVAVWYAGSTLDPIIVGAINAGKIDLLVFEVYITPPGGNWQQTLQNYINSAQAAGVSSHCILGLGSNTNYTGGYTAAQHAAFLDQQITYIRANAPQMPGVGFFDAQTLVGERALIDEVCRQQFVK
jgi:hypothetical protein